MKIKLLFILAISSLLVNCATLPTRDKMQEQIAGFELPVKPDKNKALIYVVRPSSVGALIAFNVFLDNTEDAAEMGFNRGSGYIYFYVKPGMHKLFSKAENTAEIEMNTAANVVYYIRQDVHMGLIMARNELVSIDEVEGKYHIKNTTVGNIIRTE